TLEPVRSTFSFGQINIFLALLVALDLFGRRRLLPRGVLIGVAAGVKLTPLVFLLYLVWVGRWREAATAAISFGATVAVGFAVSYGPSATYWTHTFFDAEHIGGIPYVANQSVLGVLSRLMSGPDEARPLYLPIAGLVLIAGLIAAVRLHRRGETLLAGSACALTGLIVSPISWSHHWVWLVPLLLCLGLDGARPRWGRPVALAGAALAVLAPIWWAPHGDNAEFGHDAWQIACANSYAAAATALLAALLWYSRPRGGVRTP
ncbi:glycosyltransferase 87 family protein, partial [Frankia sp. EI5c]|uniref:glycosyltransferase 87 family protein n=1 Tax=Frankia sp. EI5c TaxID=683316 RepID=UPI001F5BF008